MFLFQPDSSVLLYLVLIQQSKVESKAMFLFITFLNGFDQSLPPYKVKILFDVVFILSFYLFIYLFIIYLFIYYHPSHSLKRNVKTQLLPLIHILIYGLSFQVDSWVSGWNLKRSNSGAMQVSEKVCWLYFDMVSWRYVQRIFVHVFVFKITQVL